MFGLKSNNKQSLQIQPNLSLLVLPPLNNDADNSNDFTIGVQINSENHDSVTNQTIKISDTNTITDLSLELKGFDNLISVSNDLKTVSGKVYLKIIRSTNDNTSLEESIELSDAKYSVYPLKAATKKQSATWDTAIEIRNEIIATWQEEFAFALEDFHESLGNDFANPENSPAPKLKRKPGPVKKNNGQGFFKFNLVNAIAISAIVLSLGIFGLGYYSKSNSVAQTGDTYSAMGADTPTEQVIIPDQATNVTEAQALENETLNDFGLEAGVSLDQ